MYVYVYVYMVIVKESLLMKRGKFLLNRKIKLFPSELFD